jgi:uncharacterized protein YkwD
MGLEACARRTGGACRRCCARKCAAATLLVLASSGLPAAAPASAEARTCAAAAATPGRASGSALRRALRCAVNAERARHGLRALQRDRRLGHAATAHARDMVARGYFAHERPGWTLRGRLSAARWNGSAAGEAIAWGCGGLGVPRAVLAGWLASPPHRAIVLGPYGRVGVGLALGAPGQSCSGAGTWVLDAGRM